MGARQDTRTHRCQSSPRCRGARVCGRVCTRGAHANTASLLPPALLSASGLPAELNRWRNARRQAKRRKDLNIKAQRQGRTGPPQRVKSRPQPVEKPELAAASSCSSDFFSLAIVQSAGLLNATPNRSVTSTYCEACGKQ